MKIGDLVLCKHANNLVGLIVGTYEGRYSRRLGVFEVLVDGTKYPFREHQLEVINKKL